MQQHYQPGGARPFASAEALKLWLSERLAHESDPVAILRVTAEAVGRHLGATRIGYGDIEPGEDWMTIPVDWTDGVPSLVGRIPIYRGNAFVQAYQRGETMVVADVRELGLPADEARMMEETFCRSCVSVPLVDEGELVALFSVTYREPRAWTPEEVELVQSVGARTWAALRHVRAVARLRESEEQFRQLAENFPGICWLAGADGLAYWMNARGLAYYGDTGAAQGDVTAVVHPDDLPAVMVLMKDALTRGVPAEATLRARGADGVYHPFLSRMVPIHDDTGAIVRWCGVQVDLTEKHSRDRHEAFFRHVSEAIRDETDAGRILATVSGSLQRHLGLKRVLYIEFEEGDRGYIVHHGSTKAGDLWADRLFRMPDAFVPLHEFFSRGETYVCRDVRLLSDLMNEQVRDYYLAQDIRSGINVPLVKDGRLVAVLGAQDSAVRDWTPEEVRLVEELAERTWSTITRARAEAALQERERHQRFLIDWNDTLRGLTCADAILATTLERLAAHLGASRANYSEVSDDGAAFTIMAEWRREGSVASTLGGTFRLDTVGADIRAAFDHGEVVGSDDVEIDPRIGAEGRKGYRLRTVRAFVSAPLVRNGRVRAVFSIQQSAPRRWREAERRLLVDVAERAWVILERARAEAALKERERHGRFLIAWADELRALAAVPDILGVTLERLAAHLQTSRANYAELDGDDRQVRVLAEWRSADAASTIGTSIPLDQFGEALSDRFAAGEVVWVDDTEADPRVSEFGRELFRRRKTRAFVCVPLVRHGEVCGMLAVQQGVPRAWRTEERRLVRDVADRTWVILERARAEEALKERERNQAFLIAWSDAMRAQPSPEGMVAATIGHLGRHLGAARANYAEGDQRGERFAILQEWRRDAGPEGGFVPRRDGVSDGVHDSYLTGDVVVVEDVRTDDRFDDAASEAYARVDAVSFLGVPMIRGGRVRAVLSVQHANAHRWTETEVQLMRDVADRAWTMLERARAEAALQERERTQAFLIEWSDAVRAETGPRAILSATLDRLGAYLGVERANYAEVIEPGDRFEVIQEWNGGSERLTGRRYPFAALGERVMAEHRTGRPFVVGDVTTHPLFDLSSQAMYAAVGVRAAVTVPLVQNGRLSAVLSVQQSRPRAWSDAEVRLLCEVADRTWATLERARFEERLSESEALLAAFMENAPLGMHLKDAAGRFVRVNHEMTVAMRRPREELIGRHARELAEPEIAESIEMIDRAALAGGMTSVEVGRDVRGRYASALLISFPIKGHGPARLGGFTIDVSDRRAAEAELARSREALYQSEKLSALGSLLAGVSHELNNPLSIVVAQAVMMERQAKGTELADRAFKIRRAADRCARIVQTFLAMARQKRPEREPTDLNAVAVAALDLADYGLRADGVTVERRLAPDLPRIAADADQLHQIIINLVVNAQQAMAEAEPQTGERRLTVTTAPGPEPDTVVLDVQDTGPGVPEEVRRRVFEPFFTTKPQGQGTGVGLSFSQGLAEAHGGRLALLPSAAGAHFRLTLPIDSALTLPYVAPEPGGEAAPARRRALVVDDEREIAEALADFLSLEGYDCEVAIGGAAAKTTLADGHFDLVVSDLRMPEVDGPELHAWVAVTRPDLARRMAFITGDTLGQAAERFLADAKRPVLEKPFTPDSVKALLQQMDVAA